MARSDIIMIDGRAYSWQQLRALRREQRAAADAAQGKQMVLFELKEDCRPAAERTASGRYEQPGLLHWID